MSDATTPQLIFERYVRGELQLQTAVEAIVDIMLAHRASGSPTSELKVQAPAGERLSAAEYGRAEAFFAEMNRRASGTSDSHRADL